MPRTFLKLPSLTYNALDGVLLQDWAATELAQEPFVGPLGLSSDTDDSSTQFWASLMSTDGAQEVVWGQECSSLSNCQHSNIIRQWAELAFWFPSRSDAAGVRPLGGVQSFNFTQYAPPLPTGCGPIPFSSGCGLLVFSAPTHSYLKVSPYPSVYPAWQQIAGGLK